MNQIVEAFEEQEEFFAPVATDLIDGLIAQYRAARIKVDQVRDFIASDMGGAIQYYLEGNKNDRYGASAVTDLFQYEGAIKALNAAFWSKALSFTDILELMPHKRRDEWFNSIHKMDTPEFNEENVRSTMNDLMASRHLFFAEKIDGLFRSLSSDHVTNVPQGFSKRMIISRVLNEWQGVNYHQSGYISDLRKVIAKIQGREEAKWYDTDHIIKNAYGHRGEWQLVDGGAFRIRVYKVGTAHLEIHPDIAWRLNQVLAFLHPMAIPSEFRTKPKKKAKEFQMMQRPLPVPVMNALSSMKQVYRFDKESIRNDPIRVPNAYEFYGSPEKIILVEAERVLASIGGVKQKYGYQFDYDAIEIIKDIACSGLVPDQKSHQFYPTPEPVALAAIEMADIGCTDKCLEPSAGIGGLADYLPKGRTYCVEISELHAEVLLAKGYQVWTGDFMQFINGHYDRIVMNPPFSEGRALAHVQHAAEMLNDNGRLVAILPSSFKGKDMLPGFDIEWSKVYSNEFSGTSVSVVIMAATRMVA